ncbi:MAG: hypothetical protein H6Q90_2722 [Deltaproteobacteria bacterium]|nr:hypothetical protein [Deltaproteobacteria bacterium]
MRIPQLSALLVAAALATTPSVAAFADPVTSAQPSSPTTATPVGAPASEVEQYAAREAKDTSVTTFRGGGETIIIGASTVGILLLVLIVVILL